MVDKYNQTDNIEEEEHQDEVSETTPSGRSSSQGSAHITQSLQSTRSSKIYRAGHVIVEVIIGIIFCILAAFSHMLWAIPIIVLIFAVLVLASSIVSVKPSFKGIVERKGEYYRFIKGGWVFLYPITDRILIVNTKQTLVEVEGQELLTSDSLSLSATINVYFKVKPDEVSVKASQYNVQNYHIMVTKLAESTLRAIIGSYTLMEANSKRNKLNEDLAKGMRKEIDVGASDEYWGIEIVRTEIMSLKLPQDVQDALDEVVKQENLQKAAKYDAERKANEAEGDKQVKIKLAEGIKQAEILEADGFRQAEILRASGKAKSVELISVAENKYFVKNAQLYKRLETVQIALKENTKIIVPLNSDIVNVIGELAGVPIVRKKDK